MILNALTLYINLYKLIFINCGVTVVKVDSNVRPVRLYLMPKAICLIKCPIPCTSMSEVVEMVAYPTFLSHLSDKSLSSSGHSHDCHVIEFGSLTWLPREP